MVNVVERKALADVLIRCLDGKAEWKDLDAFLKAYVEKDNTIHDKAILGIGHEFLNIIDPEYPENRVFLRDLVVFRTLLFLSTEQEYVPEPEDVWDNIKLLLFCLVIPAVAVLLAVMFKSKPYWIPVVGGWACFIIYLYVLRIIYKPKPPSPEEEAKEFWPFGSWEAYQVTKEQDGERIREIVEGLSNT